jgi:hypothetical protein
MLTAHRRRGLGLGLLGQAEQLLEDAQLEAQHLDSKADAESDGSQGIEGH